MKPVATTLTLAALLSTVAPERGASQIIPGPRWYRSATGMLGLPPANVGAHDIERMERYLTYGVAYCAGLGAQEYAANQAMARNMSAYLGRVGTMATDPQARAGVRALHRITGELTRRPEGNRRTQRSSSLKASPAAAAAS